jgi:hypothetical protein
MVSVCVGVSIEPQMTKAPVRKYASVAIPADPDKQNICVILFWLLDRTGLFG